MSLFLQVDQVIGGGLKVLLFRISHLEVHCESVPLAIVKDDEINLQFVTRGERIGSFRFSFKLEKLFIVHKTRFITRFWILLNNLRFLYTLSPI